MLHSQSWFKHGTGAFASLPNWPIFSSYGTVFVEAVPPTCSAPVVRIKLAAYELAQLARHNEAVQ